MSSSLTCYAMLAFIVRFLVEKKGLEFSKTKLTGKYCSL